MDCWRLTLEDVRDLVGRLPSPSEMGFPRTHSLRLWGIPTSGEVIARVYHERFPTLTELLDRRDWEKADVVLDDFVMRGQSYRRHHRFAREGETHPPWFLCLGWNEAMARGVDGKAMRVAEQERVAAAVVNPKQIMVLQSARAIRMGEREAVERARLAARKVSQG